MSDLERDEGVKKEEYVTRYSSVLKNDYAHGRISGITCGPGIGPGLIPVGPVARALGFAAVMFLCKVLIFVVGSIGSP